MQGRQQPPTLKDGAARSHGAPRLTWRGAGSRIWLLVVLFAVLGLIEAAAAQESLDYAGIVIRPGDGTVTYAYVPLDEPVSGIELLRRSGVSLVTIGFGGLGEGVCQIAETGCDIDSCRSRLCQTGDRNSPYWRYFQADHDGNWVASPLGGSATKVEPGGIDGWSWTPDEALLPDVDIEDIPALAGALEAPGEAHFARYDANGNLVDRADVSDVEQRSYVAVIGVLGAVALFTVGLRARQRGAT